MNKKGFIISTTLYSIFGIMIITIFTILFVLMNNRTIVSATGDKLKMCIKECDTPENICGDDNSSGQTVTDYILANNEIQYKTITTDKFAISQDFYNKSSSNDKSYMISSENGLFTEINEGKITYFFRGAVDNNYFKFANQTWRILRINEDGSIRLVLNDVVGVSESIFLSSKTGTFQDGTILGLWYGCSTTTCSIYVNPYFSKSSNNSYHFILKYDKKFLNYGSSEKSTQENKFKGTESLNDQSIYNTFLTSWYDKNIKSYATYLSTTNNFCKYTGTVKNSGSSNSYYISYNTFKCSNDTLINTLIYHDTYLSGSTSTGIISKNIGYLSRSDVAHAGYSVGSIVVTNSSRFSIDEDNGVSIGSIPSNNDNFLNVTKPFVLSDYNNSLSVTRSGNIRSKTSARFANYVTVSNNKTSVISSEISSVDDLSRNNQGTNYLYDMSDTSESSPLVRNFILEQLYKTTIYNIRPVINIKASVTLEGNGTKETPYKIKGVN